MKIFDAFFVENDGTGAAILFENPAAPAQHSVIHFSLRISLQITHQTLRCPEAHQKHPQRFHILHHQ